MNRSICKPRKRNRRAITLVFFVMLILVMLAMVALGLDVGYMVLVRAQLQVASDSAAMAAAACLGRPYDELLATASRFAAYHEAGGKNVTLASEDVELGIWDAKKRTFTPTEGMGNAVRVTAHRDMSRGGEAPLFFARVLGHRSFVASASAVAMANPRDIAFVVDLSGSMNDDTEPCWATSAINSTFGPQGYPTIGTELMQKVYSDFGFGAYPGAEEYLGQPWGVPTNSYAYAELTKDDGPLTQATVPAQYRIIASDSEPVRKQKAYSAVIDYQIARLLPSAKPTPDSTKNYAYWEKYLDYILIPVTIQQPSPTPPAPPTPPPTPSPPSPPSPPPTPPPAPPKPPLGQTTPKEHLAWLAAWDASFPLSASLRTAPPRAELQLAMAPSALESILLPQLLVGAYGQPPLNRGTIPPNQSGNRITGFNNPNLVTFPKAKSASSFRNVIGYRTYVQFMMDFGRELKVVGSQYASISKYSPYCPWHSEGTAGGTFDFPPQSQPVHAARRALIAAMQVVKERNAKIVDLTQRDWVTVISYDRLTGGGPVVQQSLTGDYDAAMLACTSLQAVCDKDCSTATEAGLLKAREILTPKESGGQGRYSTNKVVVLLTDGVPNLYSSDTATIDSFINDNPSTDFYGGGYYWYDGPLVQANRMELDKWYVFPVGVGLGTDYNFMDRLARLGGTANETGESPRGSGNPAEYEQRLTEIFERIITNPQVRLVK